MRLAEVCGSATPASFAVLLILVLIGCGGPLATTPDAGARVPNVTYPVSTTTSSTTTPGTTSTGTATSGLTGTASTGLTSPVSAQHQVQLAWVASPSLIDGYFVYRSSQAGGPYSRITSIPVLLTTYSDTSVSAGQTYFYVVTAVANTIESVYSNETEAVIPSP